MVSIQYYSFCTQFTVSLLNLLSLSISLLNLLTSFYSFLSNTQKYSLYTHFLQFTPYKTHILLTLLITHFLRFWSSAPHLESQSPVFLKSALHINIANLALAGDDGLVPQSSSGRVHSLDSNYTTDVLRSVHCKVHSTHVQYTIDMLRSTVKQWSLNIMGFFLLCLSNQTDVWTYSISSNKDKLSIQRLHRVLVISGTWQQG